MTNANTTLAELRALNIEKQREEQADAKQESHIESNMTGHTESHTANNLSGQPENKPVINTARKHVGTSASQKPSHTVGKSVSPPSDNLEGLSVRERLLAEAARQTQPKVVMKTVTIKMKPDLDDRLEAHCYELRKKKQDVIEDALLLYFETIEAIG